MSYIGNTATQQAFTPAVDFFNGNGSTTAFTLSRPVASVAQVQAVISNVPQKPGDAYTVSGNTITFTSAPPSGTQNIYVYYTSPITQVIAPGQGTVGTAQIQNGAVIPADLSTGAPSWDTSGNVTTTGTINNLTVGRGAGAVTSNTAVGASALAANTSGASNVSLGWVSMPNNTTGSFNVGVGAAISGVANGALGSNTTGSNNVAVGTAALVNNTTASNNTAVGYQAGYANTTGAYGTFIGRLAGLANTTGEANTAVGNYSLPANTTGQYNVSIGAQSLQNNTTASNNTAVGYQAGLSNTTGANNTTIGSTAGYSLTTSGYNTMVGERAGTSTTGVNNTFIGQEAGNTVTSGTRNSILGRYNGNQGGLDIRTASNYIVLSDGDGNPNFVVDSAKSIFTYTKNYGSVSASTNYDWTGIPNGNYIFTFRSSGTYHVQATAIVQFYDSADLGATLLLQTSYGTTITVTAVYSSFNNNTLRISVNQNLSGATGRLLNIGS